MWNVTRRSVGVEIAKRVRQRIIMKRIHVRIEHVQKSRSREAFLKRVQENATRRAEAVAKGERVQCMSFGIVLILVLMWP